MPRTTNADYINICHRLAKLWQEDIGAYASRSPQDQRYIHDYYRPSENLSDKERLVHRKAITKAQPSLPASAGRALTRRYQPEPYVTGMGKRRHRITVRSVSKPQPDMKKLAQVLWLMAQQLAREKRDSQKK